MKPIVCAGLSFGVALLAGCEGPQTGAAPFGAATQSASPRLPWLAASPLARPDARRSWMAPNAKKRDLLYVSDDTTDDVYVFSYPEGELVGMLTGFSAPGGPCADSRGDVFVSNVFTSTIEEFAHGGSNPIATLTEAAGAYPDKCDVNRTNGDLAVSNDGNAFGQVRGGIAIYRGATGTPSIHKAMYHPYSCGYDSEGNLFVDGEDEYFRGFQFGELPATGKRYRKILLNQSISLPGGVAWRGNSVAVGDVYNAVIYQFAISGSSGTRVGTTALSGSSLAWDFQLDGRKVIVPNFVEQSEGSSDVLSYRYPGGGSAVNTIGTGVVVDPVGVVISRAH
ncbi:MAG: hypothetical protein WCC84_03035 [Candidatus Cybelea sp.]